MKTNRFTKLNFAKQTISKLNSEALKAGLARGTQSNNQATGCQTNCTAWKTCHGGQF